MGNVLLILLIAILSLIALMLIVALFLKKEYNLHREIIINKPVKEVFDYLKHIKNQDRFSKWVMTDPDMKKTYKGTDGTVGFVYAWDSTNKRAGALKKIERLT
jgi:predicted small secreted protein